MGFLAIFKDSYCNTGARFQAREEKKPEKNPLMDITRDRNPTHHVIPNNPPVPHHPDVCLQRDAKGSDSFLFLIHRLTCTSSQWPDIYRETGAGSGSTGMNTSRGTLPALFRNI